MFCTGPSNDSGSAYVNLNLRGIMTRTLHHTCIMTVLDHSCTYIHAMHVNGLPHQFFIYPI